jgi:sporulation protein YlmC with PRC-barrel domain
MDQMIAAELRGGNKPSLNEALGWIGSRVDDIYGASVGRLEDVWIDPGTGAPRWLLVKEGRFGGRSTLVPFNDATAGAGHVWVPYERDVVRNAPQIEPGVPLTQQVEATLRNHYAANAAAAVSHGSPSSSGTSGSGRPRATVRLASADSIPPIPPGGPEPAPFPPPRLPHRPAPPVQPPPASDAQYEAPQYEAPPPRPPLQHQQPQPYPYQQQYAAPPQQQQTYGYQQPPRAEPQPPDPMAVLAAIPAGSMIEIELEGNLTISGELRQVRITPPGAPG